MIWQRGIPEVERGGYKTFVCLMVSRHTGKDFVLPLDYLNAMPLETADDCKCAEEHDDGCPFTGWFYNNSNYEYEDCWWRAEGEIVGWAKLPSAAEARAALPNPSDTKGDAK